MPPALIHLVPLTVPMLVHHEELLQTLYMKYAELYPEVADFWETLASEELQHAGWIRQFNSFLQREEAAIIPERFHIEALRLSMTYIIDEIVRAGEQPELPLLTALTVAVHLERSLLEKKFFEVFAATSPAAQQLLDLICDAACDHLIRVQAMWGQQKECSTPVLV